MNRYLRSHLLPMSLLMACAGSSPPVQTAGHPLEVADLYPFERGNAWSYEVDTGEDLPTLAVTRVESFDGHTAVVQTGQQPLRYELRDEGIYVPEEGVWLLKAPLREGQSWPSRGGRTAQIRESDESVSTPGGDFSGCVRVDETGGRSNLQVSTVYCPGVGPVKVESTMSSANGGRAITVEAALRGYELDRRQPAQTLP
jgi:hypothetical protein